MRSVSHCRLAVQVFVLLAGLVLGAPRASDSPAASASPAPVRAENTEPLEALPVNGLGVSLPPDWLSRERPATDILDRRLRSPSARAPLYVRVPVDLPESPDLETLAALATDLQRRGLVPVLSLRLPWSGPSRRREEPDFDVDSWLERVDRLVSTLDIDPLLVQIGDDLSAHAIPRVQAFLLKRAAVRILAVRPGAVLATGPVSRLDDLAPLAAQGISAYVENLTLDARLSLSDAVGEARRAFPGQRLWLDRAGTGERLYLHDAAAALSRAVTLVLAAPGREPAPDELRGWRRLLDPDTVVIPSAFGRVRVTGPDGSFLAADEVIEVQSEKRGGRFVLLFGRAASGRVKLIASGPRVGVVWLVDPVTGEERIGGSATVDESGRSLITLRGDGRPGMVRLSRLGAPPPPMDAGTVQRDRTLTLPEILARHRRFRASQDRLFRSLTGRADIEYHFSVANLGQTFDVNTRNRYFTDGTRGQYEEQELFVNGARWRGTRRPDLPFIVPEKVTEIPLDLRLDERYVYSLAGRVRLDGQFAYLLTFVPAPDSGAPYRGKVWIDAEIFSMRRMEVVENDPALPVINNAITQIFAPTVSGGRTWWLLKRLEGQMIFTALGRNIQLERAIGYRDLEVNPPDFQERIDRAWAAGNPILRETDDGGFQRLEVSRDGERRASGMTIAETGVSRLLVTGISVGDDFIPGIPFAGVNYFNIDYKGTGNQLDIAWAGPLVSVLWSDPSLGGTRAILGMQVRVNPLTSDDKRFVQGDGIRDDVPGERLQFSRQTASAVLGFTVGPFNKFELEGGLEYVDYGSAKTTAPDFVVPNDTIVGSLTARWLYNRLGYRVQWAFTGSVRDRWEFWGRPDGSDFDPDDDHWITSSLSVNKSFFVRQRDKISLSVEVTDGNGQDRFSKFNGSQFGVARVTGFSGTGIKWERGIVGELGYSLALGTQARLDVSLDHGVFRNEEDFGRGTRSATGVSVSVNLAGPWNSFLRVRLSGGLNSTIEGLDSDYGVRLLAFRTFNRWFWQKKNPPAAVDPPKDTGFETKKSPGS